jgi:hypothetical protein
MSVVMVRRGDISHPVNFTALTKLSASLRLRESRGDISDVSDIPRHVVTTTVMLRCPVAALPDDNAAWRPT